MCVCVCVCVCFCVHNKPEKECLPSPRSSVTDLYGVSSRTSKPIVRGRRPSGAEVQTGVNITDTQVLLDITRIGDNLTVASCMI